MIAGVQYENLPVENEVRREYLSLTYDFYGLEAKIKSVEAQCEKKSQENQNGIDLLKVYKECIDGSNRDGMTNNLALDRKSHLNGADQFVRDEMDRLYKALAIKTALLWTVPIFGVVLLGIAIAWVVKGFVNTRVHRNSD